MILKTFEKGMLSDNNYLLIDEESKEAVLIDCTEELPEVDELLKQYDATLKYVLLTHGHFDHILGLDEMHEKYPNAEILVNEDDKVLIEGIKIFLEAYSLDAVDKVPHIDRYINENEPLTIGKTPIKILKTDGHTRGGVCYLIEDMLFSGDTIFLESVGRTDLAGGSFANLKKNIIEKIFVLDDNITIYPGHGKTTTVGHEKTHNQIL